MAALGRVGRGALAARGVLRGRAAGPRECRRLHGVGRWRRPPAGRLSAGDISLETEKNKKKQMEKKNKRNNKEGKK